MFKNNKPFLQKIFKTVKTNLETTELSNFENIYRSVNRFINEMKFIADKMNLDILRCKISSTNHWICKFDPGPGIGGHCIPIDPYAMLKVKQIGMDASYKIIR